MYIVLTSHQYNYCFFSLIMYCRRSSKSIVAPDPSVFLCVSMCARAVGADIESDIRPILDQMFSLGLSQELTNSLKVLANEIPALLKEIQGSGMQGRGERE